MIVSVAPARLKIAAPPPLPPLTVPDAAAAPAAPVPSRRVSWLIVTVPPLTSSSALVLPPDTDTPLTTEVAGLMVSGPLVVVSTASGVRSVIVVPASGEANTISSPAEVLEAAEPIAARREPAPESVAFVTVNVSALAAAGSATNG